LPSNVPEVENSLLSSPRQRSTSYFCLLTTRSAKTAK
jgi:hypothetical protein